ncbi:unnamed protein product [Prorocentrum cordatum]|uniref:Ubiquitin-like domain-containing protein n=1 Tax=Prorocentrum cordatum TaxID=2364126 RepID=A0ABN9QE86_9DINO|nr:unnamed protein product [Polarella glacialis]
MASRVTILRFSPPGVIDVDATPFFESPGKGARNDWDGDIGIRFVACVTFAVTHLGRACAAGGRLREAAAVQLWCAETTRALLAEADVGPSSPVEEAFAFEPLAGRVELQGGQEYRLSQRCRAGMPDLWPDARAEVGAGWHDPVEAAALAEAGQGGPPWAVAYATFVGGAYNFDGGYPSFDDLSGRRVGMVNLKILDGARWWLAVLTLDPAAHISELKAALEEVTGLPPARQRLALGHRALLSAGETLAAAGVGHGALLTLEMLSGTQAVTCAGHTARVWNAEDGSCVCTLEGHEDDVLVAEFSPDSTRVITGGIRGRERQNLERRGERRVLAGARGPLRPGPGRGLQAAAG